MATVLVVDDERDIRALLTTLLSNVGYDVMEAADGLAATEMACLEQPDVILLDVSMPALDGLEVLKRLRGNTVTRSIPVILVTALPGLKTDDSINSTCTFYVVSQVPRSLEITRL